MKKIDLLMHVSLDGFVAGPNGEMDWIHVDEELFKMSGELTEAADTALYGRVTFQMMEGYWPTAGEQPDASAHDLQHSKWYNNTKKVVLSKTLKNDPAHNTAIISDNVGNEIKRLKEGTGKNILMIGSPTAVHELLKDNLIDDFWLFVNPVLVGKGIPLFRNVEQKVPLKLISTKVYASGVVCMHYSKSV